MLKHRVIPCLLIQDGELVKTRGFKNPVYVGDPINAIRIFNEKEVDELIVIDISASRESKEPNYMLINQIASECFMPICYGGGITSLSQAKKIFSLGVEKICIQNICFEQPSIIRELSSTFGAQSIVLSVDIKKNIFGKRLLFNSKTRKCFNYDIMEFLTVCIERGVGEILLNSVDNEGEMTGYDLELLKEVCQSLPIPVIASGGGGNLSHFKQAIDSGASAVAAGSMFVFQGIHRAVLISYPKYNKLESTLN